MDIKEVVKTAILRNSHEWGDEQAEAVLKAINEAGFLVVPAKAQAVPEGFVLVPRECPDPIFADKLFDHLCEKAHGEFGDDQMIFFSDIDESAIWQLMIEAQEPTND